MVPTGRLELPRIAPLAPQASVSTNSTTSAKIQKFYGFSGPGCAGPVGAAGTVFSLTGGADGAGAGSVVVCCTLSSSDGARTCVSRWNTYVRARLFNMKIAAKIAVMRGRPVLAPRAPN